MGVLRHEEFLGTSGSGGTLVSGFNAKVTVRPAMNPQDLAAGMPGMQQAVKAYGKAAGA